MQRTFLTTALSLLLACSGSTTRDGADDDDSVETDDATDDGPKPGADAGAKGDGAKPSSPGQPGGDDDDDGTTGAPDKGGSEFAECADKSIDAQRGPRGSNIVWVVDNSGSMDEEAAIVQQNLNAFVQAIVSAGLTDYRVLLITESGFVNVPAPLGTDSMHFRQIDENVKSDEPLSDLLGRFNDYSDFLLKGVVTHFVTVTDDESEVTAENFINNMKLRLASEFKVHSIASPPGDMSAAGGGSIFDDDEDEGCAGKFGAAAEPGIQHWEASKLTGGLTFSICSEDWSSLFTELAKEVEQSAAVPCTIELPEPPAGEVLDPKLINVVFTAPGASKADPLPRVEGASACGSKRGWYYDDPAAPTGILLCTESCSAAANGGALKIALGCETFVQ